MDQQDVERTTSVVAEVAPIQSASMDAQPTKPKQRSTALAKRNAPETAVVLLTEEQKQVLAEQETIITKGLDTFLEVGRALAVIRDQSLYTQPTFEQYLKERWNYTRQRASQLIRCADLLLVLETRVDSKLLPKNERTARELLRASEDNRVKVLEIAHERTNGNPTAEDLAKVRTELEPKKPKDPTKVPKKRPVPLKTAVKVATKLQEYLSTPSPEDLETMEGELFKIELKMIADNIKRLAA